MPGRDAVVARAAVAPLAPGNGILTFNHHAGPAWWTDGIELSGHVLSSVGLQAPALAPEHLALVHVTTTKEGLDR